VENNYKGYSLFNDIEDRKMRAFNRVVTMVNINDDLGEDDANIYIQSVESNSQRDMAIMAKWIGVDGRESVRKQIIKGQYD
jgi:hypothetical protein